MSQVIIYLVALVTGILLTLSIEIIYPHAQVIINSNRHARKTNWHGVWRSIVSDWKEHRPAFIMAGVFLAIAIILTVLQSFQPNDIEVLKNAVDNQTEILQKILNQLEANNVSGNITK